MNSHPDNSMDAAAIARSLKQTLVEEAEAILVLAEKDNQGATEAVRLLFQCSGRVITTGMGKMGAIARKCAATLCSTGTPAFFLHPTEALHGDLGIVTEDDLLLALSYSGETDELIGLIPFMSRHNVPIIAITGNPNSQLAQRAKVVFDIGVQSEADPISLAPTCSTTVALAACDAIAVALMKLRGFTKEQFAIYHPGGSLGRKLLLKVSDVMVTGERLPVVNPNTSLRDSIFVISKKALGAVFIVDEKNRVSGILTDGDLRRALEANENPLACAVTSLMTACPRTISPEALAAEALRMMENDSITVLPVIDGQSCLVGALHLHHLIQAGLA